MASFTYCEWCSDMHDVWDTLVTTAVLGTERRAFTLSGADTQVDFLLQKIDIKDVDGALLDAAALLAHYRAAGQMPAPPTAAALAAPAPAHDLPLCPARALPHLVAMLGGSQRALLPEWLAALVARGWRVPPAALPDLLELGHQNAALRPALLPAIGARGRWLASQNPEWAYAAALPEVTTFDEAALANAWDTGTRSTRLALLANLRARVPDIARELMARDWASEKAEDRAALLAALETGLSQADESFLEHALDDRSKEVRRTASRLLARLPESRLAARMAERAQMLLTLTTERSGFLGRKQQTHLHAAPPAQCDAAMQRDGIEPQPPALRAKLGERAWWLQQILAAVPPTHWSAAWERSPQALIALAEQSEWKDGILEGWQTAALATHDAGWAEALVRYRPANSELMGLIPAERQEVLLLDILRGDCMPLHKHPVLDLLRATSHTWSTTLTQAVFRTLYRHMRTWRDSYDYQLRGALTDEFSRRVPPTLLPEIAAGWPDEPNIRERWQGVIDKLMITLQFRYDMLRALQV